MNQPSPNVPDNPGAAKIVAALDLGANALRMVIAQVTPDGQIEEIEQLRRAVRLGQDTFRQGRLGAKSMRAAIAIFRDYDERMRTLGVQHVRAVATSAVREAGNADTFLDRVFMATGLNLEVIDTAEESRLTVSAVRQTMRDVLQPGHSDTLIADVGGGSTLLTVFDDGQIVTSQSLRLGSVRLHETLGLSEESPERRAELLRQYISNETTMIPGAVPLGRIETFIAVGGDARFAASHVGQKDEETGLRWINREDFDKFVAQCQRRTPEALAKRFGLSFGQAETINPALLIYQILWRRTRAERMLVSDASMRNGLLLELARNVTGQEDEATAQSILQSAGAIAEKYQVDFEHAQTVADLAERLFDELRPDHGLGSRHRLLLRVAALLHEIGGYVSDRAHHKHSYYLLVHSEIFGLSREELEIVAQIARYHRRSPPKPAHLEYMMLPRKSRVIVNKLAAILRVADAIARGHIRQPRNLNFERVGDDLVVYVSGVPDLLLEQRSIAAKGDLFEDIYGMRVRLEEV
ncbi:MAG: Ppx/GppA family phosphatase [Pirellulales bacterium]|nr:Ppx/GppA family phosphatase [Pirellulales bacterium]